MKKLTAFCFLALLLTKAFPQASIHHLELQPGYQLTMDYTGMVTEKGFVMPYTVFDSVYNAFNGVLFADSTGQLVWDKKVFINGSNDGNIDYPLGWAADGSAIYVMYSDINNSNKLISMDYTGNVNWCKTWMNDTTSYPEGLACSGGYIYLLTQEYAGGGGVGHILTKMDVNGNFIWQNQFNSPDNKWPVDRLTFDESGNIYICGSLIHNMFEMKIQPNGSIAHANKYNNPNMGDYANVQRVLPLSNGNYFVCGMRSLSANPYAPGNYYSITDATGLITELRIIQELGAYGSILNVVESSQNTILMCASNYDSLTLETEVKLYEFDLSGNIILAKTYDYNMGFSGGIREFGNGIMVELSNSTYDKTILTSDRGMNTCANMINEFPTVITEDVSGFAVTNNITVSTGSISFSNGSSNTQPSSFFQSVETCFSGVGLADQSLEYTLYPNPCVDHIQIQSEAEITGWKIWSMDGKLLMNQETSGTNMIISTHQLNAGVYLLQVISTDGESLKKFIKMN
jgi:hypothetical protein